MKGQPFFFDENIFDEDHLQEEEDQPEFTREQLLNEKKKSFKEGHQAGFTESENSLTQKMLIALNAIEQNMSALFAAEGNRNKTYEVEATHLATKICQKLFPEYMTALGENELRKAIATSLSAHTTPPEICIRLNPETAQSLSEFIQEQQEALHKKIEIKPDQSLSINTCNFDWPGGGVIIDREDITQKTFDILVQSLAEHNITLHDENENLKDHAADTLADPKDTDKEA